MMQPCPPPCLMMTTLGRSRFTCLGRAHFGWRRLDIGIDRHDKRELLEVGALWLGRGWVSQPGTADWAVDHVTGVSHRRCNFIVAHLDYRSIRQASRIRPKDGPISPDRGPAISPDSDP